MTVKDRIDAIKRAQHALTHLETHPSTRRDELGTARDYVNTACNVASEDAVWSAIFELEGLVCLIYGGRPTCSHCA